MFFGGLDLIFVFDGSYEKSYLQQLNMKTSRTNSFRLHRVDKGGKSGSIRKTSQSFYDPEGTFKLAAINSVSRGVKHADLSFLTGADLNKLRVEPLQSNQGDYNAAHCSLADTRKRYDQMKKQRLFMQDKISKYKEEIGKFQIFKVEYQDKISQAKSRTVQLTQQLQSKKQQLLITNTQKKVLLNMEARHRADKIFYDQSKFDCQQELSFLRKQLGIFRKEGLEIDEAEGRSTKVCEKLQMELEGQRMERNQHVQHLQDMINEKLDLMAANTEREGDLYDIASRAIQDKNFDEKQWRKIFQTNLLVNRLLRGKIQKQMQKFIIVQMAFKQIKTATGVTDSKSLVDKYLNKQIVYGQLLSKIAENEKTINNLKNQTQELNRQFKELQSQLEVLNSMKIKTQDLHDYVKILQLWDEKALLTESYRRKLGQWVVRQLKKYGKKEDEISQIANADKLKEYFNRYLQMMNAQSEMGKDVSELNVTDDGFGQGFISKQSERITRIVPKKSRVNSIGEQIFDVGQQQANPNSYGEELALINNQREDVLRNNQRFMKELKRKKDEERKLMLDKKENKVADKSPVKEMKKVDD